MALPFPPGLKEKLLARFTTDFDRVTNESYPGLGYVGYALRLQENGVDFTVDLTIDPIRLIGRMFSKRCSPGELTARDMHTGVEFIAYGSEITDAFTACNAAYLNRREAQKAIAPTQAIENIEKLLS